VTGIRVMPVTLGLRDAEVTSHMMIIPGYDDTMIIITSRQARMNRMIGSCHWHSGYRAVIPGLRHWQLSASDSWPASAR
jgi:hypothetical protein